MDRDQNLEKQAYMTNPPLEPSAARAMAKAAARVRDRIEQTLEERPDLAEEYALRLEEQSEIDRRKAAGEPIPASLVRNPFYVRLYRERGMLLEDGEAAGPAALPADAMPAGQTPEGDPIEDADPPADDEGLDEGLDRDDPRRDRRRPAQPVGGRRARPPRHPPRDERPAHRPQPPMTAFPANSAGSPPTAVTPRGDDQPADFLGADRDRPPEPPPPPSAPRRGPGAT